VQDIERFYCDIIIHALLDANDTLQDTAIEEAIEASYVGNKGDTLGLDQNPENAILQRLREADNYAAIVTEEKGEDVNPLTLNIPEGQKGARTFFACDPTDRSSELQLFLTDCKKMKSVGEAIGHSECLSLWESSYGAPAEITGANAAITCVRRGIPICTGILNYLTQKITIACSAGIFHAVLPQDRAEANLGYFQQEENIKYIRQVDNNKDDLRRFVAFVGKPERGYPQNIANCKLMLPEEIESRNHYGKPGGPTRMLYLTDLQSVEQPVGFIMANGEKIGEWMHWLPFIRSSVIKTDVAQPALKLYEISQDSSLMRDGYLLMPSPVYSIFRGYGDVVKKARISVDRLESYPNPSKYRATLLIAPASNHWVQQQVEKHGYQEINFMDL